MSSIVRKLVTCSFLVAALFTASSAWAHPGPAHIHEGPGMVMHHDEHSPFDRHPHSANTEVTQKDQQSLHCALNGHDPSRPCPHMKSHQTGQDGTVRIGMDCGGETGPDGKSVVKTGGSFYGVVSQAADAPCIGQELFPSLHPMLSRSPEEIAPPPQAPHSN